MLLNIVHNVITEHCAVIVNSEIGRQWTAIRRTPGSLLQRCLGNCLWWLLWQCRCYSCLQESWLRVNSLFLSFEKEIQKSPTLAGLSEKWLNTLYTIVKCKLRWFSK